MFAAFKGSVLLLSVSVSYQQSVERTCPSLSRTLGVMHLSFFHRLMRVKFDLTDGGVQNYKQGNTQKNKNIII